MTLKEVSQITGIPYDTLLSWSSSKDGSYRRNLAKFLKSCDRALLQKHFGGTSSDMMVEDGDIVAVEKVDGLSIETYPTSGKIIAVLKKGN